MCRDLSNLMKQEKILRHKTTVLPDSGYKVRVIEADTVSSSHVSYSHRDDYYIVGVIARGKLDCYIDFRRYLVESNSIIVLTPGQVHQFVVENDMIACMVAVDPRLLDETIRHRLDQQQAFHAPIYKADDYSDFTTLCKLIERQKNVSVGANLVRGAVEIIIDKITSQYADIIKRSDRKHELMFRFRKLLGENITKERRPGFYAGQLNISTVYLNEIAIAVTGRSTSEYIKNEIILLAKRELFYTSDSIKEISLRLGFSDNAYFSRLFTETAGVSPNVFRRNLDKSK